MDDRTGPDGPARDARAADRAAREEEETTTDDEPNDAARHGGQDERDGQEDADAAPFWLACPGEVRALLAAYRSAVRQADGLAAALHAVGLSEEVVEVSAGITPDGRPLVRGVLTLAGARRLAAYLAAGGPPPPGLPVHDGLPPWAA